MNDVLFTGPGPDALFAERLAQGRFEIQRCDACGRHVFMPRVLCPHCGAAALSWVAPSGGATVYSTTTVRRRAKQGGDYNVSIIALDEGPQLMSRVEGIAPDAVRIGMRVCAGILRSDGHAVLVFRPEAAAGGSHDA
ncbi:OB-fold domain-containing protein [Algiphilus sp. W345]|uniref:OB-fold domain-containing protein n=1 Tax=Banduia mediterranea TaxID=3075609 RepID=A0ABU2WE75_9GAMM|nr:OB-fold domain-containing protein [Algiphilus sp. W345]MDT0496172.1 OB-fold domain-containing protein [Algiphilus sp. W345]